MGDCPFDRLWISLNHIRDFPTIPVREKTHLIVGNVPIEKNIGKRLPLQSEAGSRDAMARVFPGKTYLKWVERSKR